MKRRTFIGTSLSPLLFPSLSAVAGSGLSQVSRDANFLFHDERFAEAVTVLETLAADVGAGATVGVHGDVTPIWTRLLKPAGLEQHFHLAGVTTESFVFCLDRLLKNSHTTTLSIQRLNQDLYAWTLDAVNK